MADHTWDAGFVTQNPTETAEGVKTFTCKVCGITRTEKVAKLPKTNTPPSQATTVSTIPMYRLYNPNSGEHFYTSVNAEKKHLVSLGWRYEGIGWYAPSTSRTPVYRIYNPNAGDHHYTTSTGELNNLVKLGWRYEGIGWYSDDTKTVPLYRQYNPHAKSGAHNYTVSKEENTWLVGLGWRAEGIAWYGCE